MDVLSPALLDAFDAPRRLRERGGAYLASNTMGIIPRPAIAAELDCLRQQAELGVAVWDEGGPWGAVLARYQAVIGRMLDVAPSQVCPVTNITDGLWRVLSCFDFARSGRGILTTAMCFTTQEYASWGFAEAGARLTVVPSDPSHWTVPTAAMVEAIHRDKPAVVHLSHATFESSYLHDLHSIAQACREEGTIFCLDIAQTGFVLPMTLASTGADVILLQQHKWGCAGTGAAALVASPDFCARHQPRLVGWMSHARVFSFQRGPALFAPDASRFTGGTPDVPSKARGAAAAELLVDEVGLTHVRERNLSLQRLLIDGLRDAGLSPIDVEPRGAFVAVQCEDAGQAQRLEHGLRQRHIVTDARGARMRIGPHFYNEEGDVERCVEALAELWRRR